MPCNKLKGNCKVWKCDWIAEMRSLSHLSFSLQSTLSRLIDIDWSKLCSIFQQKKNMLFYILCRVIDSYDSQQLMMQRCFEAGKDFRVKQHLKCMHFHSYLKFGFKIIIKDLLSEINLIVWLYVEKLIAIFILKF